MWYGIYFFVMPVFAGWLSTANHNIREEIGGRVSGGVSSPENGNKLKKYIWKKTRLLRLRRWRQSAEERVAQQHQQPARDTRLGLTMGTSDRFLFYFIFKLLTSFCGFHRTVFSSPRQVSFHPSIRVVLATSWYDNRARVCRVQYSNREIQYFLTFYIFL